MRPKPSLEPTTKETGTNSPNRARAKTPVWRDDRCPGDWKSRTHDLNRNTRKCAHCYEAPIAYADPTTGELA